VNASDEGGDIDDEAMTPPLTETALMMASRAGSAAGAEVAHLLIAHRADVNAKDITDWTALHYAIANDNVDVARVLLEADADPGVRAKHNGDPIDAPGHTTPLMMAIRRGNLAMVTLLLGHNKIAEIITTSTTKGPMMVV
jgi:ankyrin repeat protein